MDCDRVREAISATLDGEEPGVDAAVLDRHLRSCFGCRQWQLDATDLTRAVRLRPAELIPDLSSPILRAIGQRPSRADRRWTVLSLVRLGLVVIAALQLLLAGPDFMTATGHGRTHSLHELGTFDVALAVGFIATAWRPIRAHGMLPLMAALAAGLVATATVDVSDGHASVLTESVHLLEFAGFTLVWLLTILEPGVDARRRLRPGHGPAG